MSVDYAAVQEAVATGSPTIFDVRNPGELEEKGKIPKTVNVPFSELKEAVELSGEEFQKKYGCAKPGVADPLIVHCNKGGRAAKAATLLTECGFSNIRLYQGSFNDWVNQGGPLEK